MNVTSAAETEEKEDTPLAVTDNRKALPRAPLSHRADV